MDALWAWLQQLGPSEAIRTTPYVYAVLESVHVLGIALLVGPALVFDLRLLGIGRSIETVTSAAAILLPIARIGFVIAALTGAAMFASGAANIAASSAATWKLGLILLAGINIAVFHTGVYRSVNRWNRSATAPLRARLAAIISAATWTGVIAAGRLLAYT